MLRIQTLKEEIIPSVVGKFGPYVHMLKCEVDDNQKGEAQYASTVLFAKVTLRGNSGQIKEYPVIVKYELANKDARDWLHLDQQFYNELYMYEIVLPFLERNRIVEDLFPKFYYGVATLGERPEKDILILQDLRDQGYRLSDERVFLDYDHVVLAMQALGRFHALSYAAKKTNPERFLEKASRLIEVRYSDKNIENNYYLFKYSVQRATHTFLDTGKYVDIISKFKEKLENIKEYFDDLMKTDVNMTVICHGDFCRNNVLYKYDDHGRPVAIKLFDVAAARLSSPVIDISLFLFMSSTAELRRRYWDDFLSAYHEALRTAIAGVVVPTLDDVHREVRRKAVYGFLVCTYWLPTLTSNAEVDCEEEVKLTPDERGKYLHTIGDETDTKYLGDIFDDLVKKKCELW